MGAKFRVTMAESKPAVAVSFLQNGIAVVRMQRGENKFNSDFIQAFNDCLDEIEK